jgi:hypothetical protein
MDLPSALPPQGLPALGEDQLPCVAYLVIDGAVRDLVPTAWKALGASGPVSELSQLKPILSDMDGEWARRRIEYWTGSDEEPICDPAPGSPCGPRKPPQRRAPELRLVADVEHALDRMRFWRRHPGHVLESLQYAARAYRTALDQKLAGTDKALARLQAKLAGLAQKPAACGL